MDLVGQHGLGCDFAAPVRDPGGLGGQCLASTLWWTTAAADQQLSHRAAVAGVVLQRAQELLASCVFHSPRVQFDDLQTSRSQPRDQVTVIMARGPHVPHVSDN